MGDSSLFNLAAGISSFVQTEPQDDEGECKQMLVEVPVSVTGEGVCGNDSYLLYTDVIRPQQVKNSCYNVICTK